MTKRGKKRKSPPPSRKLLTTGEPEVYEWEEPPNGVPAEPTKETPGSRAKIDVMIARIEAGKHPHALGDKTCFGDNRDVNNPD